MDTLRGHFSDRDDDMDDVGSYDSAEEDTGHEGPPPGIGHDERRMQVRAYNHWAGLLEDRNYPAIEDLEPEKLPDFGPYSVLLDFTNGIDNPGVSYLGDKLAVECDAQGEIRNLSDVPSRSLLSRITDHYMQILANQAPIGFEAEFVNQRGSTILYRGILLPYSSDDDTIDFIYGVINWKEMADPLSTDELMLQIDQALEPQTAESAEAAVFAEDDEVQTEVDVLDLGAEDLEPESNHDVTDSGDSEAQAPSNEDMKSNVLDLSSFTHRQDEEPEALPKPTFGFSDVWNRQGDDEDDDEGAPITSPGMFGSLIGKFNLRPQTAPEPEPLLPPQAFDDEPASNAVEAEVAVPPVEDIAEPLELSVEAEAVEAALPLVEEELAEPEEVEAPAAATEPDLPAEDATPEIVEDTEIEPVAVSLEEVAESLPVEADLPEAVVLPVATEITLPEWDEDDLGIYDMLASARELALTALNSEDRSRTALYDAIGKAYDFSLAAKAEPQEFEELLVESGLTAQERAPMTPVVKLIFGVDYDKTRITEYATALGHAHRIGLERGRMGEFLRKAEGGLKAVVSEERRLRREEAGVVVEQRTEPRSAIARKLRKLEPLGFDSLAEGTEEFALVMIRRTPDGEIVLLGEIPQDIPLIERAAKKLLAGPTPPVEE